MPTGSPASTTSAARLVGQVDPVVPVGQGQDAVRGAGEPLRRLGELLRLPHRHVLGHHRGYQAGLGAVGRGDQHRLAEHLQHLGGERGDALLLAEAAEQVGEYEEPAPGALGFPACRDRDPGDPALAERALQLPAVPERGGHVHPVPRAAERVVEPGRRDQRADQQLPAADIGHARRQAPPDHLQGELRPAGDAVLGGRLIEHLLQVAGGSRGLGYPGQVDQGRDLHVVSLGAVVVGIEVVQPQPADDVGGYRAGAREDIQDDRESPVTAPDADAPVAGHVPFCGVRVVEHERLRVDVRVVVEHRAVGGERDRVALPEADLVAPGPIWCASR